MLILAERIYVRGLHFVVIFLDGVSRLNGRFLGDGTDSPLRLMLTANDR